MTRMPPSYAISISSVEDAGALRNIGFSSHLVGWDSEIFSQPRILQTLSEESIATKAGVAAMTLDIREEMLDDGGGYYIANVFSARNVLEGHAHDPVAAERWASAVAGICGTVQP